MTTTWRLDSDRLVHSVGISDYANHAVVNTEEAERRTDGILEHLPRGKQVTVRGESGQGIPLDAHLPAGERLWALGHRRSGGSRGNPES
jgi:hypothetical protein